LTAPTPESPALTFTGERFQPEVRGAIWYEHWHRYAIAAPVAAGKRVLDAACGEGYGSFLLAQTASEVIGVDLAGDAVAHARQRYARSNLRFETGSVTQLPVPDAHVDAIVSFETIEHLAPQQEMLAEFRRVLRSDGVLVLSSPNRPVYSEGGAASNPFHVRELDRDELRALLAPGFPQQAWYAQRVLAQSVVWAEGDIRGRPAFLTLDADRPRAAAAPAPPMYFLVVAAANGVALPALAPLSTFDDGSLALWRDYARALVRERELAWAELEARKVAEDRLAELVPAINALASAQEMTRVQAARIGELESALDSTQRRAQAALGQMQSTLAEHERALRAEIARVAELHAHESAAHGETRARLAYRESARGWLRFPFGAMRQRIVERR
jgi:SAM-dependent methyltransferase